VVKQGEITHFQIISKGTYCTKLSAFACCQT